MNLLDLLGGGITSILSGGATGLIGVVAQRYFDHKKAQLDLESQKLKQDHEVAMREADSKIVDREWAGRAQVASTEAEAAKDVAASQAFGQTLLREPERYSNAAALTWGQQWILVLLDAVRGSVRPFLTVYLCALTTYIWYQVRQLLSIEDLEPGDVLEVWKLVVSTILYLTTTVVLWWFGTRNKQGQPTLAFKK